MRLLREEKKFSYEYSASDGRLFLEVFHFEDKKAYLRANDMFCMFYDGISEIEKLYPANVKLKTD